MKLSSDLSSVRDREAAENILEMAERFVEAVDPLKIYLFGSFAKGTYTDESDYDFFIVVDDERNLSKTTDDAYRSVRHLKRRPVDIVVRANSGFQKNGPSNHSLLIDGEVWRSGVMLYERT